ncbi:hypothetical protein QQF64_035075 [Cirrhinus molitorella]|uniref:Uncharacterized protein n=1 Tax=Cirrhinus molitorella TaxID=172907 RepID=A0ABR3NF20_9TELE
MEVRRAGQLECAYNLIPFEFPLMDQCNFYLHHDKSVRKLDTGSSTIPGLWGQACSLVKRHLSGPIGRCQNQGSPALADGQMSGQVPSVGSLSDDDDEPVFGRSLAQMVRASPSRCFPVSFTFSFDA